MDQSPEQNSLGSRMKKGFRSFCNGESSTSTMVQQRINEEQTPRLTREEMILQVEVEGNVGRKTGFEHHRMSCVDSSDVLRSARNALNQHPRFSLDGKEAMYRSVEKARRLPCVVGGESVIWCKAGVVAELMGIDAMPIPLNSLAYRRERLASITRRRNLRRENEMRKLMADRRGLPMGSCSRIVQAWKFLTAKQVGQ